RGPSVPSMFRGKPMTSSPAASPTCSPIALAKSPSNCSPARTAMGDSSTARAVTMRVCESPTASPVRLSPRSMATYRMDEGSRSRPDLRLAPLHELPIPEVEPGLVVRGLDDLLAPHVVALVELHAVGVQLVPALIALL